MDAGEKPRPSKFETMPCLTYFDISGRAEATRLAFTIGGIHFEDKRISFAEFPTLAPSMPFTHVPVLEVGTRREINIALVE